MNSWTYKGYFARIEFDPEDEIFVGHLAGINGIIGFHAGTVESLKAVFMRLRTIISKHAPNQVKEPERA